jgi:eukaryotic-like serine/threonine-protein kinase
VIATARSGSDFSSPGSVLGTPSYMAPEQARGEIELVDERADVFALGSILCEVLTGGPAFTGRSSGELQRKAAVGDTADALARLDACGADLELVALARDCLAREREDRPRDANAVSGRLTAHLAGVQERLRRAEMARAAESARAEEAGRTAEAAEARARAERRARRLTAALAASVLGLVGLGSAGYAWAQTLKAEQTARIGQSVDEALADAARLRDEARSAQNGDLARWGDALAAVRRAVVLAQQGDADARARRRVDQILAVFAAERDDAEARARQLRVDRELLARLEAVRGDRSEHMDPKRSDADYADAFRKAGLDLDMVSPAEAGKWISGRSDPAELVCYLDDWALMRRSASADPDRQRLFEAGIPLDAIAPSVPGIPIAAASVPARPIAAPSMPGRPIAGQSVPAERISNLDDRAYKRKPASAEPRWRRLVEAAIAADRDGWRNELRGLIGAPPARREETLRRLADDLKAQEGQPVVSLVLLALMLREDRFDMDRAINTLRWAAARHPGDFWAHYQLAWVFSRKQSITEWGYLGDVFPNPEESIRHLTAAAAIRPSSGLAHTYLAFVLWFQGKREEAMVAHREAIRVRPDTAWLHGNLGNALLAQGRLEEAIAEFREAARLKPAAWYFTNIGSILRRQGRLDEAVAEFRMALQVEPADFMAHQNLGAALTSQGKFDEAVAELRVANMIQPNQPGARRDFGDAFAGQGKLDEAIAEYRESFRFQPDNIHAHQSLGKVLSRQGKYAEALEESLRVHELMARRLARPNRSIEEVRKAELEAALARRLGGVLYGPDRPASAPEMLDFARLCKTLKRYAAACRLFAEAFAADPKLAEDPTKSNRYNAACAAALAGSGQGNDDPPLDDASKVKLRRQALDWLKAELAVWNRVSLTIAPNSKEPLIKALQHWKEDTDLAGIRDEKALAELPETERTAFQRLWKDVDQLLGTGRE